MKDIKKILLLIVFISPIILTSGCQAVKDITKTLTDIQNLKFKLMDVDNFRLAGVDLSNKKNVSDISITDGLKLTRAFSSKKIPASFILDLGAKNPNTGSKAGSSKTELTLTGLEFRLIIDGVPTITGNIANPVTVPASGTEKLIPISVSLDLYDFFGNKGYDRIIQTALAIGGVEGSATKVEMDAKPTVRTPIGSISSPRITIVSKEWR